MAPGGRLILPLGPVTTSQELLLVEKKRDGELHERRVLPVRFVPLTGDH